MEFHERFKKLLDEKGITASQISKDLGIPKSTVDSIIKKKIKNIYLDRVFQLANYLHVSVEYLATGNESLPTLTLSHSETEMIMLWRRLSTLDRAKIVERIEVLLEQAATADREKIG